MSAEICMAGDTQSLGMPALVGLSYYPFVYFYLSFASFVAISNADKVIFITNQIKSSRDRIQRREIMNG